MNAWQIPDTMDLVIRKGGIVKVEALHTPGDYLITINGVSLVTIIEEMKNNGSK